MPKQTFQQAIELARDIENRFEKIEGRPWGIEGALIELSKQMGELSKHIMVQEGYYNSARQNEGNKYQTSQDAIGDELADILFMIIRIADLYQIDLEEAHYKALKNADTYLKENYRV